MGWCGVRESDVIVIGGGLAGLMAAATAARQGKKVTLLTKGAGTLTVGSGVIDVLGYVNATAVISPYQSITALSADHPYTIMGRETVEQGLESFLAICREEGYPFTGSLHQNIWLPTVAGTLKPSCLAPESMNPLGMECAAKVVVVGFQGLKDFYPRLVVKGLKHSAPYRSNYHIVGIDLQLTGGRDVTFLDIARRLDTAEGRGSLVKCLSAHVGSGDWVLLPPVLGTEPDYNIWKQLEQELGCRLVELVAPPPAVTGSRLHKLFVRHLRRLGVNIVENAFVRSADCSKHHCRAVISQGLGREREYFADAFILATGGFLGGGIIAEPGRVYEPIMGLPVETYAAWKMWSKHDLFACTGQMFGRTGIRVNRQLNPIDSRGEIVLQNVYLAGKMLAGYDYCLEKSGNGVAVVSGYQAAIMALAGVKGC